MRRRTRPQHPSRRVLRLVLAPKPLHCAYCWDRGFVLVAEPGADPAVEWLAACTCARLTLAEVVDLAEKLPGCSVAWAVPPGGGPPLPYLRRGKVVTTTTDPGDAERTSG